MTSPEPLELRQSTIGQSLQALEPPLLAVYILAMSKDAKELDRLTKELADLTPEERARVIAEAERAHKFRAPPRGWRPKVLTGAKYWNGGPLTRDDLYSEDGR